ncbi:MAG TPA: hypothetical protein PLI57_10225, partial [Spirochaetota bacterium]|nr:hypothetical protein [Spirochaetota bacterium]
DAGLAADTMYFYKIKSVDNKARESEFSAPTFAKTSTSTTIPTKSVVFNLVITLDQSIDQVKGKTFDDIGSIKLTSGTGVFDGETNNVSDYFKIYQKTAGGPITFNVSGDVCEAQISAQTPYDGARWVYFEAYYTDGKTTLSEQKYPDNFTINSDTTTLTADTTLDSVYGDIGINLETNN